MCGCRRQRPQSTGSLGIRKSRTPDGRDGVTCLVAEPLGCELRLVLSAALRTEGFRVDENTKINRRQPHGASLPGSQIQALMRVRPIRELNLSSSKRFRADSLSRLCPAAADVLCSWLPGLRDAAEMVEDIVECKGTTWKPEVHYQSISVQSSGISSCLLAPSVRIEMGGAALPRRACSLMHARTSLAQSCTLSADSEILTGIQCCRRTTGCRR